MRARGFGLAIAAVLVAPIAAAQEQAPQTQITEAPPDTQRLASDPAVVEQTPDADAPSDEPDAPTDTEDPTSTDEQSGPETTEQSVEGLELAPDEIEPTDAEIDALLGEQGITETTEEQPTLHFYGFADFGWNWVTHSDVPGIDAILGPGSSFAVGNLNLYLEADLTEGWRSLSEVRFTYLPNGSIGDNLQRQNTSASDYTEFGRASSWGGIEIERAWLEYIAHPMFTIRGGHYLTPVGIWNVDHGSPTIITVTRPYVIGDALFPEQQTGLEIHGSMPVADSTFGYHLTLSNGRGAFTTHLDQDKNKAIGGRVFGRTEALGSLSIGLSAYRGRATTADLGIGADGLEQVIESQFDELSYGADLLWQYEGLHVQSELLVNEVVFTEAGRSAPAIPTGDPGLLPDYRRVGAYLLLAYQLPSVPIMPFVLGEHMDTGVEVPLTPGPGAGSINAVVAGVNIRPTPTVTLKAQYQHVLISADDSVLDAVSTQAAWSF